MLQGSSAAARGSAICLGNVTPLQTQLSPSSQGEIPFRSAHFGTKLQCCGELPVLSAGLVSVVCNQACAACTPARVTPLQQKKGN